MDDMARERVERLRGLLLRWFMRDVEPQEELAPTDLERAQAWREAEEYLLSIGAIARSAAPQE